MEKLGFIGCGNMAKAMIGGIISAKILSGKEILVSSRGQAALKQASEQMGFCAAESNREVAAQCKSVVLAVKPQFYSQVIEEIKPCVTAETVIIAIAPGWSIARLEEAFGQGAKVVRTMPNTPAMVGEGMTAVCAGSSVTKEELEWVCSLMSGFGKAEVIEEYMMNAVIPVSGSSPAYIYMFIEAMADAAVMEGMPRAKAYQFAAQTVYGSAKMVLETGMHPGELKDMVCSPAGTTIAGVAVLEERGFRSAVIEAMRACAKRAREM